MDTLASLPEAYPGGRTCQHAGDGYNINLERLPDPYLWTLNAAGVQAMIHVSFLTTDINVEYYML